MTFIDLGAMAFGTVIGWFTYFVNRHRGEVKLTDVATIIGALGGGAVLALFPQASRLFAAYGLGLAFGFFGYFIVLFRELNSATEKSTPSVSQGSGNALSPNTPGHRPSRSNAEPVYITARVDRR